MQDSAAVIACTVKTLSLAASNAVHDELKAYLESPPGDPEERRRWMLLWSVRCRKRLSLVYAICTWVSRHNGGALLQGLAQVKSRIASQRSIAHVSANTLESMREQSWRRWSRLPDVSTAIHVLNGSYPGLPRQIAQVGSADDSFGTSHKEAQQRAERETQLQLIGAALPTGVFVRSHQRGGLVEVWCPGLFVAFISMARELSQLSFFECRAVEVLVGGATGTRDHCVPSELELASFAQYSNEAMRGTSSSEKSLQALCCSLRSLTSIIAVRTFRAQVDEILKNHRYDIRIEDEDGNRAVKLFFWPSSNDFVHVGVETRKEPLANNFTGKSMEPLAFLCHDRASRFESLESFSPESISASDLILEASRICSASRLETIAVALQCCLSSLSTGLLTAAMGPTAVLTLHPMVAEMHVCGRLILSVSVDLRTGRAHAFIEDHNRRFPSTLLRHLEESLDALFVDKEGATGTSVPASAAAAAAASTGDDGFSREFLTSRALDTTLIEIVRCGILGAVAMKVTSSSRASLSPSTRNPENAVWDYEQWDLLDVSSSRATFRLEARLDCVQVTTVGLSLLVSINDAEASSSGLPQKTGCVDPPSILRINLPSPEFVVPRKRSRQGVSYDDARALDTNDVVLARVQAVVDIALTFAPVIAVALELLQRECTLRITGFSEPLSLLNLGMAFSAAASETFQGLTLEVLPSLSQHLSSSGFLLVCELAEGNSYRWTRKLSAKAVPRAPTKEMIPLLCGGQVSCFLRIQEENEILCVVYKGLSAAHSAECALSTLSSAEDEHRDIVDETAALTRHFLSRHLI